MQTDIKTEYERVDLIHRIQQRLVIGVNDYVKHTDFRNMNYTLTNAYHAALDDVDALLHPVGEKQKARKY